MTLKLRHVAPAVILAPTVLVFACGRAPSAAPAPPASPAPTPATTVTTSTYECSDGRRVTVAYDGPSANLRIGERNLRLETAMSASGARYVGDGIQWWTKGPDEGRLSRRKAGEDVASDEGVVCRSGPGGYPLVEPPAPGTPGGLPDERTPISETFTPDSPQGAADVVQTYYAHIGQKDYGKAWALWRDGGEASGQPTAEAFAKSFEQYVQYDAQVGAPSAAEGAAGSIYVTTPVVIYGRLKTGAEVHEKGEAVLRRVNDVPGATAEQRRWRIAKIKTRATPPR